MVAHNKQCEVQMDALIRLKMIGIKDVVWLLEDRIDPLFVSSNSKWGRCITRDQRIVILVPVGVLARQLLPSCRFWPQVPLFLY